MDLFIKVIDEVAVDAMWEARRAFWLRYFEMEAVSDVHVAFASRADRVARAIRRRAETRDFHWAALKGAQPDHSVLLMRIGGLTIAEWSHSGKMRFWREGNRSAPKLHRDEYQGPELRRQSSRVRNPRTNVKEDGITHDAAGRWQAFAERVIADETGVRP